jgi:hypothetical protein
MKKKFVIRDKIQHLSSLLSSLAVDKKSGTNYVDFQCPARRRTLKISAAFSAQDEPINLISSPQKTSSSQTKDGSDRERSVFFSFAAALVLTISPLARRTDLGIFGMGGTPWPLEGCAM